MYRCDLAHACIRPNNNNTLLLPRLLRLTTRSYQKHSLARHFVVVACVALRHNFALVCGIALEFSPVCAVTFARQPTVRRPLPVFFSFCGGFRNTAAAMHCADVVGTFGQNQIKYTTAYVSSHKLRYHKVSKFLFLVFVSALRRR